MSDLKLCHRCGRSNESVKFVYNLCLYCDKLLKATVKIVDLKSELKEAQKDRKVIRCERCGGASQLAELHAKTKDERDQAREQIAELKEAIDKIAEAKKHIYDEASDIMETDDLFNAIYDAQEIAMNKRGANEYRKL